MCSQALGLSPRPGFPPSPAVEALRPTRRRIVLAVERLEPRLLLSTFGNWAATEVLPLSKLEKVAPTILAGRPLDPAIDLSDPTDAPVDTLQTAKVLPTADSLEVTGNLDPVNLAAMYCVLIDETTSVVRFVVRSSHASNELADNVTLYDDNGHQLLQVVPMPGEPSIALTVPSFLMEPRDGRPHAVYVKVAYTPPPSGFPLPGGEVLPSLALTGFVLEVTRQSISPSSPKPPSESLAPAASSWSATPSGSAQPRIESAGGEPVMTEQIGQAPADIGGSAAVSSDSVATFARVATGPLPSRSAAPLGGILGGSIEPTPVVTTNDTLVVDLALQDLPGVDCVLDAALAGEASPRAASAPRGALVRLRGPGGVPLFGSSLIAENEADDQDDADFPAFAAALATRAANVTETSILPTTNDPRAERAGTVRRVSAAAGLSVALVFATGLVLPDLTDPTRADPSRRSRLRCLLSRRLRPTAE